MWVWAWLLLGLARGTLLGEDFVLIRHSVDGGGGVNLTAGDIEVSGTIGQPDAGVSMTGGDISITGGFWFAAAEGDCNTDSAVNMFDYESFEQCLTGPQGAVTPASCHCFDADRDGDADLADYARFQDAFTDG
jgi:hypothetical protein